MKARIADPEKIIIARQQYGKHVSVVINNHTTTEELLEVLFSMWKLPRLYKEIQLEFPVSREYELPSWVSCERVAIQ
jgi:hypothetical protein